MKKRLSLLMITKNSDDLLEESLNSIKKLVDEIVIVDDGSVDRTVEIAKQFNARVYVNKQEDLGLKRQFGLNKIKSDWVLMLDADEIVTNELADEIKHETQNTKHKTEVSAYYIPYQNHFLGREVKYGGENYKIIRLIKRNAAKIYPSFLHEKFDLANKKIGELKGKILHYSYRSVIQMFTKFTDYAKRAAKQKVKKKENVDINKLFFYGPHMFWARFIKDRGYKDGMFRLPLDLGFAYMEGMTYWFLLFYKLGIMK